MGIASAPAQRRLDSIQALRGVAAVLVVTTHAASMVFDTPQAAAPFLIGSFGQFRGFGAVGVDLFFIISGFVMAFSVAGKPDGPRGAGRFLVLRWIRVGPPYLIVTALMAVVLFRTHGLDWRSLWNAILFVPVFDGGGYTVTPLVIGWTLSFEFTFYLLIALAVLVRQARRVAYVGLLIAALVAIGLLVPHGTFLVDWITNPIYLEFAMGILAHLAWAHGWFDRARALWGLLGLAGLAALVVQLVTGFGGIADMYSTLDGSLSLERTIRWGLPCLAVFAGCVALWRSTGRGPAGRALTELGDSSYSLYLIHLPVVMVLHRLLLLSPVALPADLAFAATVLVSVAAGVVYYRLVERPVTRMLRSRFEARGRIPRERAVAPGAE